MVINLFYLQCEKLTTFILAKFGIRIQISKLFFKQKHKKLLEILLLFQRKSQRKVQVVFSCCQNQKSIRKTSRLLSHVNPRKKYSGETKIVCQGTYVSLLDIYENFEEYERFIFVFRSEIIILVTLDALRKQNI